MKHVLSLSLVLASFSCLPDTTADAGMKPPVGGGGGQMDAGVDAGSLCDQPKGTFVACSPRCGLCAGELVGFSLYSAHNPGCVVDPACVPTATKLACPMACPDPAASDEGAPTVFTRGQPFDAGPSVTGVLAQPVTTSVLSLPAGTRFVVVRQRDALAQCTTSVAEGFVMNLVPPSDGGALAPGVFPVSSKYQPPPGTVVATLNSSLAALDGSVTITALSPKVQGTFDLYMVGASGGGILQGSINAVPCEAR